MKFDLCDLLEVPKQTIVTTDKAQQVIETVEKYLNYSDYNTVKLSTKEFEGLVNKVCHCNLENQNEVESTINGELFRLGYKFNTQSLKYTVVEG